MDVREFYKQHMLGVILGGILTVLGVIVLGCLFLPTLFYDQWIWKYYWGPIVADALGHPVYYHGVEAAEKYTVISEVTYGFLVIVVLSVLYKLVKQWRINVDWRLGFALIPFVLTGSVTRVLEDSKFFTEPFVYWFVSPLIYVQILIWALIFLLLGYYLQRHLKKRYVTVNTVMFTGGFFLLLPFLYFTVQWLIGDQWGVTHGVRFDVFFLITGLVCLILGGVYAVSWFYRDHVHVRPYSKPLNLAMIGGHLIDGITSYISIYDPLHLGLFPYREIHPASGFLMDVWPPLFPIVKFLLIVIVIYVFDVLYKEELKNHLQMVNLLKIGIFILGFAPGVRDLLRVMMGV